MAPKLLSMTGGRRQNEVDGCDENVDFDTICEATQNMLCRMEVQEGEQPQDPDTLDYVFEHVESVICYEDEDGNPINIHNSFIDYEDNSEPEESDIPRIIETFYACSDTSTMEPSEAEAPEEIPAPVVVLGVQKRAIGYEKEIPAPVALQKDILDYVFEKVESLVCQDDAPDDHCMGQYGSDDDDMSRDNSLIAALASSGKRVQARKLWDKFERERISDHDINKLWDKCERERISDDDTVVEVLHDDDGVEMEVKSFTKKKKSNKKSWIKKLACVVPNIN